jgi:hypothetical protein
LPYFKDVKSNFTDSAKFRGNNFAQLAVLSMADLYNYCKDNPIDCGDVAFGIIWYYPDWGNGNYVNCINVLVTIENNEYKVYFYNPSNPNGDVLVYLSEKEISSVYYVMFGD